MPVDVVVGADIDFPIGFYFRYEAFLVALRVQAQNLIDSEAVAVSNKAVLRWPEELPVESKNPARRPGVPNEKR